MLNRIRLTFVSLALCLAMPTAFSQSVSPCPGFNPNHNTNLACEIATATRISTSGTQTLGQLSPTVAAQLSQLPVSTAISGSGFIFSPQGAAIPTDSLGTILTQRGETLGEKHKFFVSFSYQRFGFGSIDGVSLKHLDTINQAISGPNTIFIRENNRVDLLVDQFTTIGSFALTDRLDLFLFVPFAKVTLKTGSAGSQFDASGNPPIQFQPAFFSGSATGIGDIALGIKKNVVRLEHTNIAIGGEVRLPTGDETNFLGTGAYGLKPYIVISRTGRKITPNINIGYQWNGPSSLFINPTTGEQRNLPSSFLYSGGVDLSVIRPLTLNAEFIGQAVVNGPRLDTMNQPIPHQTGSFTSLLTSNSSYAMDNIGFGFKYSPFQGAKRHNELKGLLITGNALIKLDDGGLRSKIVPLVGVSYRFKL